MSEDTVMLYIEFLRLLRTVSGLWQLYVFSKLDWGVDYDYYFDWPRTVELNTGKKWTINR